MMASLLLLGGILLFAQAAPGQAPAEVTFEGSKSLEELAEELFGDAQAAVEIRALNGLDGAASPPTGARLRLPGPEREQALAALKMAAQALAKINNVSQTARGQEAAAVLERARAALRGARYQDCRRLADDAWALARLAEREGKEPGEQHSRFAVSVDDQGNTTVGVVEGEGVKVTSGKDSVKVAPGEVVRVRPGAPPGPARRLLEAPRLLLPNADSLLVTRSIFFRWEPVAGAVRYVLLVARDREGSQPVRQITCEATSFLLRSRLPDGEYFWMLRSVDADGMVGPVSEARRLVLQEAPDGGLTVKAAGEEK